MPFEFLDTTGCRIFGVEPNLVEFLVVNPSFSGPLELGRVTRVDMGDPAATLSQVRRSDDKMTSVTIELLRPSNDL
jgi:hypothetical protein